MLLFWAGGGAYVDGQVGARNIDLPLGGLVYRGIFGLWLLVFCFRSAYLVTQHWFAAAVADPHAGHRPDRTPPRRPAGPKWADRPHTRRPTADQTAMTVGFLEQLARGSGRAEPDRLLGVLLDLEAGP